MTREGGWERVTRGRDEGDGQEREHRGDGRRTRMSSLDACLLDLAVQGLGLPLVTTP